MAEAPRRLTSLDEIASSYPVILCDVWGVVHNGVSRFPEACRALQRMREAGKAVVLVTNAPRPWANIAAHLDALGVPRDCWDRIVSSGDVTRDLIGQSARRIFHIGTEADEAIYDGLDVELVEEFEAGAVVCTGLYHDEVEEPSDYAEMLLRLRSRDLPFICANPDIVVERGDRLIWCAGALARDYGQLGGRTLIAGKPFRPIYEAALRAAGEVLGNEVGPADALAIGDGVLTDLKGAAGCGIDVLFISAGIHAAEYGDPLQPDAVRLGEFLRRHGQQPLAAMPRLV